MHFTAPFCDWLKRHRNALDLTQEELAHRAHYSVQTIRKLESGALRPSRQGAAVLAESLQIPAQQRHDFLNYARGVDLGGRMNNPYGAAGLPATATSLIGRAQDVQVAGKLLLQDGTRLLTLFGPPGVGKTRLAIAVAASLGDQFDDGVCFVSLAPVSEPGNVSLSIA
jgi:DNA-binding XRE family transcriptional regulator